MAFYWWSVPLFVVLAAASLLGIRHRAAPLAQRPRRVVVAMAATILAVLTLFAWWVNQGEPSYLAELFFLVSFGVLVVVLGVFLGVVQLFRARSARATR